MDFETFSHSGLVFQIGLNAKKDRLCQLQVGSGGASQFAQKRLTSDLAKECRQQLVAYLDGRLENFDIALELRGTDFQKSVWEELSQIPYGQIISYKELAENIGRPQACRAVGGANGANPVPLIIPCHRVVAHKKKGLGGYALGLELKKYFLKLEGADL